MTQETLVKDKSSTENFGPFTVKIEWHYDYNADHTYLGGYTNRQPATAFYINVQNGALVGPTETVEVEYKRKPDHKEYWDCYPEDYLREHFYAVMEVLDFQVQEDKVAIKARVRRAWDWLHGHHVQHEGRYYRPFIENYCDVDDEEKAAYIKKDFKRLVNLHKNYWSYMGCVVRVYVGDLEIGYDSLWGIESDADESSHAQIEQDCVHNAMYAVDIAELRTHSIQTRRALELLAQVDDPTELLA